MHSVPFIIRKITDAVIYLYVPELSGACHRIVLGCQAGVRRIRDVDDQNCRVVPASYIRVVTFAPDVGVFVCPGNRIEVPHKADDASLRAQ